MKNVVLCSLLSVGLAWTSTAFSQTRTWVFGDSLSDTGNLDLIMESGIPNAYLPEEAYIPDQLGFQRISNGKVAVEYIAEANGWQLFPSLAQGAFPIPATNFATFGARIVSDGVGVPDLPEQIGQLAQWWAGNNYPDLSNDQFILFLDANDVLASWLATIDPTNEFNSATGEAILDQSLQTLAAFVTSDAPVAGIPSLKMMGVKKLMVLNVPNIAHTPWVSRTAEEMKTRRVKRAARLMTAYFKEGLADLVEGFTSAGFIIDDIDVAAINRRVRAHARRLGFTNKSDNCFDIHIFAMLSEPYPGPLSGTLTGPAAFDNGCSPETANNFMFFDTVHPSAKVHQILAERILRRLAD